MPQCQLFRVARLVQEASGGQMTPFWIDTCCVPVNRNDRRKALKLMNKTYHTASVVLVLGAALQAFPCYSGLRKATVNIDVELWEQIRIGITLELLMRISTSSWTTRLWTLPEGQLGGCLKFQFADGAVDLRDLLKDLGMWPFIGTSLHDDLNSFFVHLRPRLRAQRPGDQYTSGWLGPSINGRFISLLYCLEWRNTS